MKEFEISIIYNSPKKVFRKWEAKKKELLELLDKLHPNLKGMILEDDIGLFVGRLRLRQPKMSMEQENIYRLLPHKIEDLAQEIEMIENFYSIRIFLGTTTIDLINNKKLFSYEKETGIYTKL